MAQEFVKVQASSVNAAPVYAKSETELARQIADWMGWCIVLETGEIVESTGRLIARDIETVAAAARELGWMTHPVGEPDHRSIVWARVRDGGAQGIRAKVAKHGDVYWQDW